ncbi:MAG: tRNA (N6-threonylcarbamoyladenosine(37)-N6)-methyltransferase TrmO [Candidatus Eiseniibacteriota bacterium]|jgi:tRNA-Thr(GGU) m(6)t(6)A37 methyltransferase TsaA
MDALCYTPIGIIHTPHTDPGKTPVQPVFARGVRGEVELEPGFVEGLADLDGFSHVILIYHLHRAPAARLTVVPYLEDVPHGLFATRAPCRPNPIGLSVVRLDSIEGNVLVVDGVDMLDGSPLLDVKPYVPRFEETAGVRCGWLDRVDAATAERRGRREASGD